MHPTPKISAHARLRCQQMGVSTKRAKRVVREADIVYVGNPKQSPHAKVAMSNTDREIAVVFAEDPDGQQWVLTVLYRGVEFTRPEAQVG
jgi:hypothetical protein